MFDKIRKKINYTTISPLFYTEQLSKTYLTPSVAGGTLKGKTAFITGATGGIGSAVCMRMAAEGCKLIISGRNEKKLIEIKESIVKNLIIALVIDREYPYLKGKEKDKLAREEIRLFLKDIWSVSLFRIGSTLFNSTDNIIISMLLGTVVVGYYSNYFMIISQITIVIGIFTRSFVAGIGNVIAKETKEKQYSIFKQLDFAVFFVSTFCTTCLFQLLNSFVKLWIGGVDSAYLLSQVVCVFCATKLQNLTSTL